MMTEDDPLTGEVLDGKYRIDGLIGKGGFGRVYRALHLGLKSEVAIKMVLPDKAQQPTVRARFRREAVALGRLRHPAIVTVYDVGERDGSPYMVMELVRGRPLTSFILIGGQPSSFGRIGAILDQLLEVLELAHGVPIVHRDLKPDNILILDGGSDRIKVLDFGLALLQEAETNARLTSSLEINGTPHYMSPEQCEGQLVGPASDVYAAGVILYELLATVPPFDAGTSMQILAKHMFVQPPPIARQGLRRTVPPALEALVSWALAKKPTERPTATQLRHALAGVLKDLQLPAPSARGLANESAPAPPPKSRAALAQHQSLVQEVAQGLGAPMAAPFGGSRPLVALYGVPAERAEALRTALGVNGLDAEIWLPGPPPPGRGEAVQAVLLGWDGTAAARLVTLRADKELGRKPALVIDIEGIDETPRLIRAGASDALLLGAPDEQLCRKVLRLVRRGR